MSANSEESEQEEQDCPSIGFYLIRQTRAVLAINLPFVFSVFVQYGRVAPCPVCWFRLAAVGGRGDGGSSSGECVCVVQNGHAAHVSLPVCWSFSALVTVLVLVEMSVFVCLLSDTVVWLIALFLIVCRSFPGVGNDDNAMAVIVLVWLQGDVCVRACVCAFPIIRGSSS